MHELNIFFNKIFVGVLFYDEENETFDLEYDIQWIKDGFPISPKLDFGKKYSSRDVKSYIENLLPEGDGLDSFINYVHISKNNKFGLLKVIGNETSGALSFISGNKIDIPTSFREITNEEMAERIEDKETLPIFIWDEKPRLSVAGVQEKLPVCKKNNAYGLAEGELSSTHILKFDKNNLNLVLNEYMSLKLAKAAGINIPNAEIVEFNGNLVLEVERFDRKMINGDYIEKVHVIDSCQALSLLSSYKYERNFGSSEDVKNIREGVSFTKLKELSTFTKIPIVYFNEILKWTIFNLIIGNSDAHGKNISFFVDKDGLNLTPFYDLVNILIYKGRFNTELAMAIDDEFNIDDIKAYDIAAFCYNFNTSPSYASTEFNKISKSILDELSKGTLVDEVIKYNSEFVINYVKDIEERIEYLKDSFYYAKDIKKNDI